MLGERGGDGISEVVLGGLGDREGKGRKGKEEYAYIGIRSHIK